MNYLFVPWIAHAGLALSIGIGATINAGILFFILIKRGLYQPSAGWSLFLVRLLGALFILTGIGMWAGSQFDWISLRATPFIRIADLLLIIVLCMVSYFGALFAMGFRLRDFKRTST